MTSKSQENTIDGQTKDTFKNFIKETEDTQLLEGLEAEDKKSGTGKDRKIQKIPKIMRQDDEYFSKHFKPKELSIGPIHADDHSLFKKTLKLKLAAYFIKKSGRTGDDLLEKLKQNIDDIKAYFDEEVIKWYSGKELIRLVFLDGCAILGFIDSYMNHELNMLDISTGQAALIQQDLFLLENQIPYLVLDTLITKENFTDSLLGFLSKSSIVSKTYKEDQRYWGPADMPDHILDLHRRTLLKSNYDSSTKFEKLQTFIRYTFFFIFFVVGKLLCFVIDRFNKSGSLPKFWSEVQYFRNVQELKAAGIKFKPIDSLREVTFRSRFSMTGRLSVPALVVDNSTERMLLNLVAYEMILADKQSKDLTEKDLTENLENPNNSWVTSYVNLLDLLIDNEQDVKDLRAAKIIRNHLSSDSEVSQLINNVGSNCFAPTKDTYRDVKNQIEKHYRRRCAIWAAQVCNTHFSSPLTVLALIAATVVLILTGVQTWYAINPKN